VKFNR